jgi:hypothetical protein
MNLAALGGFYAPPDGPQRVLVGVAIVAAAAVLWESWEVRMGNHRPALKVAAGIMLSFLGGMAVEQGNWLFWSHANTYTWTSEFILGLACLVLSFTHFIRRRAPRSFIEWLHDRNKPPLMFDKKDD